MQCPNCDNEMKYTLKEWEQWTLAHWDCEHGDYCREETYSCRVCKIKKVNGKWIIPQKLLPTDRQIKTILFINNHLNMELEALTKHQCWLDIGKYFNTAKNTPLPPCEIWGDMYDLDYMNEADFY